MPKSTWKTLVNPGILICFGFAHQSMSRRRISPDVLIIRSGLIAWCYGRPNALAEWPGLAWTFRPLRVRKSSHIFDTMEPWNYLWKLPPILKYVWNMYDIHNIHCIYTNINMQSNFHGYPCFNEGNNCPDWNAWHRGCGKNAASPVSPCWVGVHGTVVLRKIL